MLIQSVGEPTKDAETVSAAEFTADTTEYSASDALKDATEPTKEPEVSEAENTEEAPNKADEETELQPDPEPTDEAEGEDVDGLPPLDPQFAKAKEDHPELKELVEGLEKRHGDQDAGYRKLIEKQQELVQQLGGVQDLVEDFYDPEKVDKAVEFLFGELEKTHGRSFRPQAKAISTPTQDGDIPLAPGFSERLERDPDTGRFLEKYEQYGYASEVEMLQQIDLQKKDGVINKLVERLDKLESGYQATDEASRKQAELQKTISRDLPKVKAALNREFSGFGDKVTEKTLQTALEKFPNLAANPVAAVKACFTNAITSHVAGVVAGNSKRGPEMLPKQQAGGRRIKDPEDYNAADAYLDRVIGG